MDSVVYKYFFLLFFHGAATNVHGTEKNYNTCVFVSEGFTFQVFFLLLLLTLFSFVVAFYIQNNHNNFGMNEWPLRECFLGLHFNNMCIMYYIHMYSLQRVHKYT